jgi:hypothetical protein
MKSTSQAVTPETPGSSNRQQRAASQEVIVKALTFVGALVLSFVLGGVTTLLGFPRYFAPATHASVTISPEEITRAAGPLPPEIVLENYQ